MNADRGKPRILIVEDEAIVACDLQACLESFGCEVPCIASSGEQALKMAGESAPDLVLMDIQLGGGLDGVEVAEKLRSERQLPVIFLTANCNDEMVQRAKFAEPHAYLLKPYQARDLRIAIEMALHKCRMEQERQLLTRQLEKALAEAKTLRGLIPICAWCRKVRTGEGHWLRLEAYLEKNTDGVCSHSICPECQKKETAKWEESQAKGRAAA